MLYITHDLATARHFSDEIMVMYHGDIVEHGPSDEVILHPKNQYTKKLLGAAPDPDSFFRNKKNNGNDARDSRAAARSESAAARESSLHPSHKEIQ